MCYVSINIKKERKLALETTVLEKDYKLPDG
jgi:actin-related protein 2